MGQFVMGAWIRIVCFATDWNSYLEFGQFFVVSVVLGYCHTDALRKHMDAYGFIEMHTDSHEHIWMHMDDMNAYG